MLVKDCLDDQTCRPVLDSDTVSALIASFRSSERTTLPVTDRENHLVGVISLHDLLGFFLPPYIDMMPSLDFLVETGPFEKKIIGQILDPFSGLLFLVSDIMKTDPVTVGENDHLFSALLKMVKHRFHHLPVVGPEGEFRGMLDQRRVIIAFLSPGRGQS